ncbi:TetR/AcrR family transcriptional regulator [Paenibacillus beijingensis]|uniref:HTH tetR-type domain-containing protein n=1 Tax=Paenibacillus beijingensis TaxID=1126833 RepID=A0A0D5NJ23_9BACL|nr:TetR/AcrR family transcriptional regulator [Paenibacillus beijingensis]AJY75369.1 hypothetical protein VN24_13305 [Paenibacillus beijingensis]
MAKGLETRERIIYEARKLFAEKGFNGTTTAEIAKQVGVTDAALYKHFKGKQDLFIVCILPVIEAGLESTMPEVENAKDLKSLIRIMMRNRINMIYENLDSFNILYSESLHQPKLAEMFMERFFLTRLEKVRQKMIEFVESGEIASIPSRLILGLGMTSAIWAILNGLKYYQEQPNNLALIPNPSLEQLTEELTDFVLYGIAGKK